MAKIQRISKLQQSFSLFSISENYDFFYQRFLQSELGKIYQAIPWKELVSTFGLKEKRRGRPYLFSPKGRIALMFLKNYAGISDDKLIEQLNGNIEYQFFCDISLEGHRIPNGKIISQIRCELAKKLSVEKLEDVLYNCWKPHIKEECQATVDATCYESSLRYPTDQKLLWESVYWLYKELKKTCKSVGINMIRSKFIKWNKFYIGYSKMRRKTNKKRRSLTRALLRLLKKFLDFEKQIHSLKDKYSNNYNKRITVIKKIYFQQYYHFTTGKKIKNRIVSISKDYVRPIVRGKEIKKVEFGAKVNKIQIDGLSFIEHINFNAFNEGTRLISSVYKAQRLARKKLKILGADAIYATNKNRNFVSKNNIKTDFKRKGRKPKNGYKEELQLKKMITKERATRLEGSFGVEKEYYHLRTIRAKTKKTEILWIFFGIHTKNAVEIGRRIAKQKHCKLIA